MSPNTTPPPTVPAFHDVLPKYISAFENRVHAYVDKTTIVLPPPSTVQGESYDCVSPLISPFPGEKDSSSCVEEPANLRKHDGSYSYERLLLFQIYVTQCQTLQSSIRIWDRQPHGGDTAERLRRCYSKIRRLAMRMRQLAEALGSRELQARSEYWAGRGCGGLQDWLAAMTHFAAAIKLDVPNDVYEYEQFRRRGLHQKEKDDVEFLLRSATQHQDEWLRTTKEAHEALKEPSAEDIDCEALKGPCWRPDHDFMTYAAKQQRDRDKMWGKLPNNLRSSEPRSAPMLRRGEIKIIKQKMAIFDGKQAFRTTLSAEEWQYILRGDKTTKRSNVKLENSKEKTNVQVASHRHSRRRLPSSSSLSLDSSQDSLPEPPQNLCNELEQAGYSSEDEETSPLSPESMSPSTN